MAFLIETALERRLSVRRAVRPISPALYHGCDLTSTFWVTQWVGQKRGVMQAHAVRLLGQSALREASSNVRLM